MSEHGYPFLNVRTEMLEADSHPLFRSQKATFSNQTHTVLIVGSNAMGGRVFTEYSVSLLFL